MWHRSCRERCTNSILLGLRRCALLSGTPNILRIVCSHLISQKAHRAKTLPRGLRLICCSCIFIQQSDEEKGSGSKRTDGSKDESTIRMPHRFGGRAGGMGGKSQHQLHQKEEFFVAWSSELKPKQRNNTTFRSCAGFPLSPVQYPSLARMMVPKNSYVQTSSKHQKSKEEALGRRSLKQANAYIKEQEPEPPPKTKSKCPGNQTTI